MTDQLTDTQVLRKAANILHRRGLARGQYSDGHNGPVCGVAAVRLALGDTESFDNKAIPGSRQYSRIFNALDAYLPGMYSPDGFIKWQDRSDRTKRQVLAYFEYVAMMLEGRN